MPKRKESNRRVGWMLSVMFNSLLILVPVIGARTLAQAYAGTELAEKPGVDAIAQTSRRIDAAFADRVPRDTEQRFAFWQDKVVASFEARDYAALRGYLLAAPAMLPPDQGEQIRLRAEAEIEGTAEDRLIRSSLRKLPEAIALQVAPAVGVDIDDLIAPPTPSGEVADGDAGELAPPPSPEAAGPPAGDSSEDPAPLPEGTVISASIGAASDEQFQLLGSYADLAILSQRWLAGDRRETLTLKLTGLGLAQQELTDGLSDATARAVSVIKSADRAGRLDPAFVAFLEAAAERALPDSILLPALEAAFSELATTEVRSARVRDAFRAALDREAMAALEKELGHIDRIATLMGPKGTIALLAMAQDGSDLRRLRLIAEAGRERAVALVDLAGREALSTADAGVQWTARLVLQVLSLTAAALVMFWVTLSTLRLYIRLPQPKGEPQGSD